jgi:hypothetical protein
MIESTLSQSSRSIHARNGGIKCSAGLVQLGYDHAYKGDCLMTLGHNTNDKKPQHWRTEFGVIRRAPRPWNSEVADLLDNSWPATLFLRENKQTTDIVLRLPLSSRQLSKKVQEVYFGQGISIKDAFEEII